MNFPIEVSKRTFFIGIAFLAIGAILLLYIAYTQGFFSGLKTPISALSTQPATSSTTK